MSKITKPKKHKRKNRRSNGSESDTMITPKYKKTLSIMREHSLNKEDIESVNENAT